MYPPCGTYNDSYEKDMAIVRTRTQWALLIVFLVLLFAVPIFPFVKDSQVRLISNIAIIVIAVQGINIATGYCGQITLGQAAFAMVGAYTSAIMTGVLGLPFWISLLCAGMSAVLVGLIFALPAFRVKGLYLALTTLGAHFIITWTLRYVPEMYGLIWGATGLAVPAPTLGGMIFDSARSFYYLAMLVCVIMVFIAKGVARSGLGRAFVAIRDNDKAAEAIGINIFVYKLIAFGICSFYAGIAGSLLAHLSSWVGGESLHLMDAIWWVGMAIIGGLGTSVGPIFGVIFMSLLELGMRTVGPMLEGGVPFLEAGAGSGLIILAYGLVVALFLIYEPRGLAHRWEILKSKYRLWPYGY